MKQTPFPLIFGYVVLGLLGVSTLVVEAQTGKQIYSSRQPGAPRRTQPMYDDQPVFMDQPVIVDPSGPRMAPLQPWQPPAFPTPSSSRSSQTETVVMEGPSFVRPRSIVDIDPNRPLSGIDFPTLSAPKKSEEPKTIPTFDKGTLTFEPPRTAKPDAAQVDEFYARLAKLQLEKKQLDETLTLIEKITNDAFKVKTLVELAEYVAHDANYRKEADQLFVLAQNGIDALANGKPISIVASAEDAKPAAKPILPVEEEKKVPPKKPMLLDEPDEPKPEPVVEEKQPVETPKKPMLLLDDEPVIEEKKPTAVPKKPSLLDDDKPAVEEKKPAATPPKPVLLLEDDDPMPEEKKPAETPKKKPVLLLEDDEPMTEEKKPAETSKKKPILLLDDESVAEEKKPATAPKESDEPAKTAPTRRALPGKKLLLDDE